MVQPDMVLRWHRRAFAWHWTMKSRRLPGKPEVVANIRDLIRRMSQANPLWGTPRIHGELLKARDYYIQKERCPILRRAATAVG